MNNPKQLPFIKVFTVHVRQENRYQDTLHAVTPAVWGGPEQNNFEFSRFFVFFIYLFII